MKLGMKKTVEVEAKTLKLHIKCRDMFEATLEDVQGEEIGEYEGYVPGFFPGDHYGDYLILDIDVDSGQITNWNAPDAKELAETFAKVDDED